MSEKVYDFILTKAVENMVMESSYKVWIEVLSAGGSPPQLVPPLPIGLSEFYYPGIDRVKVLPAAVLRQLLDLFEVLVPTDQPNCIIA